MKSYTHKLYLTEKTKLLEGILCQSIAFTNSKIKEYSSISALKYYCGYGGSTSVPEKIQFLYKTPVTDLNICSPFSVAKILLEPISLLNAEFDAEKSYVEINQALQKEKIYANKFINKTISKSDNFIEIAYNIICFFIDDEERRIDINYNIIYVIDFLHNEYPTKRWTFTDAVKRVLQLAEPLYKGEEPRFELNDAQAEKYANTYISETTMTSCTLREQLKHLGNFIHAEPRLGGYDENGILLYSRR